MEKYNKSISKFIMLFIIIIVALIYYFLSHQNNSKIVERQDPKSILLRNAISYYILESDDQKLTFGDKNTIKDIDLLIIKLQKKIIYEGKSYGEYLKNQNYPNEPKSNYYRPYKNTKIIIYKNQNSYESKVYVGPSENNDIIEMVD